MEAVRGRFHFYGINYKGCVIQVVLLRNKWVEQLLVYFYNTAVENNFLIITSFSDFILSYNSKNRHLEFLNLSPQGLISSCLKQLRMQGRTVLTLNYCKYRKVASSNMYCLEAHADFFRLLMKGIFDPFDKKLIS